MFQRHRWHDGTVNLRVVVLSVLLSLGSAGTAVASTVPPTVPPITAVENEYIPEGANLGDCVSSLPRPGCGSESRSGPIQLITFGVLMSAMAFIGWRIFRSVRQRDRQQA